MRKWIFFSLLLLLASCSWGKFEIPKEDYQQKVQVLGVLPILVDRQAYFEYPQRETLLDLLERSAAGKHEILLERLREKKGYFDVRTIPGSPELIALSLLSKELPPDAQGRPQGYLFDQQTVVELTEKNVVDALLVVVLAGSQVNESRRSRTLLETLETTYNDIYATAAVVDRNGQVLWKLVGPDAARIAMLQYADFDEAYYNRTDLVRVKNISMAAIEKGLQGAGGEGQQKQLPEAYDKLFDRIVSGISPGLLNGF